MLNLKAPIIGEWPSGEPYVIFQARELERLASGSEAWHLVTVCWTPKPAEWAQLGQILKGLSEGRV